MPELVVELDHLGIRFSRLFPLARDLEVSALHVADLRGHDHLVTRKLLLPYELAEHGSDGTLACAVGVVGGGVDDIDAAFDGVGQRGALSRAPVHAIRAEAQARDLKARLAER